MGAVLLLLATVFLAVREWTLDLRLRQARRACEKGQWTEASRLLTALLARHPDHQQALLLMARVRLAHGEWQPGFEHLRRIPEGSPLFAESRYYEGLGMLDLDRGAGAEKALRECLAHDPDSVPARQLLVDLYLWEDRRSEARMLVWELYDLVPVERRCAVLDQLFRVDFAEYPAGLRMARLERFVAQNLRDIDAEVALAGLYDSTEESGRRDRAEPLLREVFTQQPRHVACRAALVQILLRDDAAQAKRLLEEWPPDQRDEQYFALLGQQQQEHERDFALAAESFRRVLESHPENWRIRFRLSACLRALGQNEQADSQMKRQKRTADALKGETVEQLLRQSPSSLGTAEYRHRLGELYETIGRLKEAHCWYQEALRTQPSHRESRQALDRLRGRPDTEAVDQAL